MAGSANYQLGIPEPFRGTRATYTVGTFNRHRAVFSYTPRDGDGKDFISVERLHDDSFGQNRAIDRGTILGRVRLFDDPKLGTLSLLGSAYVAQFELPGTLRNDDVLSGKMDPYGSYDHAGSGLSGRGLMSLSYKWQGENQELTSMVYGGYRRLDLLENFTGFLVDPINGDRRGQMQSAWSFGANVSYTQQLSKTMSMDAGVGVRGDVLDQSQQHLDQQEKAIETERSLNGVQSITHGLIALRFRPVEELQISAGGRLDMVNVSVQDGLNDDRQGAGTLFALSPRLIAEWRFAPSWQLFTSYGRGFRPPEARAFTSFTPDRNGISEDLYSGGGTHMTISDSFEIGTRWFASRYLGMSMSAFLTMLERESVFDHISGVNLELNSTRRIGGELEVHSNPLDWLTLRADVTYVNAQFVDSGNPIPLAPWLVGNFRAIVTHESGFRAGLRFMTLAPRSLAHGAQGAPMYVFDVTSGYTWGILRVDLEIENLLNQLIREGEYHYASNWNPSASGSEIPVIHYSAGAPLNGRLSFSVVF